MRHGTGKYIEANGDEYNCDWVNGKKHGFGTWTSYGGKLTLKGEWFEDKFVKLM